MTINVTEKIRKMMGWCPLLNNKTIAIDSDMEYACVSGTKGSGILAGKSVVYEESAPYGNSSKLILTLGFLVLAFLYYSAVFGHYFGLQKMAEWVKFYLLFWVSLYAFGMWGFFSIKFRITNDGVEAVTPSFKYGIPFSEIKEVRTIENIPWYFGWGMRFWGRRLAFISMRKRAVLIEKNNGFFRKLILTTQNPEEFIKKLKEGMG
jgi:hypothetical protein